MTPQFNLKVWGLSRLYVSRWSCHVGHVGRVTLVTLGKSENNCFKIIDSKPNNQPCHTVLKAYSRPSSLMHLVVCMYHEKSL